MPATCSCLSSSSSFHIFCPGSIVVTISTILLRVVCYEYSLMASAPTSADQREASDEFKKGVKHLVDTSKALISIPSEFILPLTLRPSSVSHLSIPLIDLTGLNGPPPLRDQIVRDISNACADWGFFQIRNHGVEEGLMEEMVKLVEDFFNLPWEDKAQYASDDVMSPVRYGTSLNTPNPHVQHWRDYFRHWGHPLHKSFHLWPTNPPNYRQVTKEYLEEIWKLFTNLAGAISEGLGLEKRKLVESLGEGTQIIVANYYPPCPQPDLTLGLAAHSDHGALTILMDNVEGLEVRHNHKWVRVPHIPATFVCNIGDYLEILSNGKYRSVEHRAVVNKKRRRISIGVGHGPELSSIVAPAAQLADDDGGPKYKPVTYADYMKHQQSIVSRGKTALEPVKIDT